MSFKSCTQRIDAGLRGHPWLTISSIYLVFAALWMPMEAAVALLFPSAEVRNYGPTLFVILVAAAALIGLLRATWPSVVRVTLPGLKENLEVRGGSLFIPEHHIVIAVNEFFDSELGPLVSPASLHGTCITKLFSGNASAFEDAVDAALVSKIPAEVLPARGRRTKRYAVGTTAVVPHGSIKLFLVALSKVDPMSAKASATVEDLVASLQAVWRDIRDYADGMPVVVPLLGTGLSGVPILKHEALRLMIMTLGSVAREASIAAPIAIVLPEDMLAQINLRMIGEDYRTAR